VIEDATPENANGSCERVLRVSPSPKDNARENATQEQPQGDKERPSEG